MNELSLFTGIGGGVLASKMLGHRIVGYVEWEDYPQRVLQQRIKDGLIDNAPIYGDIRTFASEGYAEQYQGMVDIVSGGFPCQPFSTAGARKADGDERNMWPATLDVIRAVQPRYAFLENVPGLLSATVDGADTESVRYFGTVLSDLAEIGYDAEWGCLSCADVGGPHKRDRLWILAYANAGKLSHTKRAEWQKGEEEEEEEDRILGGRGTGADDTGAERARAGGGESGIRSDSLGNTSIEGLQGRLPRGIAYQEGWEITPGHPTGSSGTFSELADTSIEGSRRLPIRRGRQDETSSDIDWGSAWMDAEHIKCIDGKERPVKPGVRLLVDGYSGRVDEIKGLGNAQVPLVAATAFRILIDRVTA